jgi:hypothetical protein
MLAKFEQQVVLACAVQRVGGGREMKMKGTWDGGVQIQHGTVCCASLIQQVCRTRGAQEEVTVEGYSSLKSSYPLHNPLEKKTTRAQKTLLLFSPS